MGCGLDAFSLDAVPKPFGAVAAVTEQPLRFEHVIEQRCRASVVAYLGRRHEEAQGAPVSIGDGMELGVHTAFGAANQAAETLF